MATWGPAVSSNDVYEDVKYEFLKQYNAGDDIQVIKQVVIDNNKETIESSEDGNNFWFALAHCLWDCQSLDKELLSQVKAIIDSGQDLELWNELGATKSDLKKRQQALEKFLAKISIEKPKPRKRKKVVLMDAIFAQGDCIIYQMESGRYGGAVVLEAEQQTEFGLNLVAVTTLNTIEKPNLVDFKKAQVLIDFRFYHPDELSEVKIFTWVYAKIFKKSDFKFEKIGDLMINEAINFNRYNPSYNASWDYLAKSIAYQAKKVALYGPPKTKLKIRSLIYKKWFQF